VPRCHDVGVTPTDNATDAAAPGRLLLAATPLGNLGDATQRLRDALATADIVAAEDTRRALRLAHSLDITIAGRVLSFYDAVEQERTPYLLEAVRQGSTVLVISDAGTPGVSDPGYRLVVAAVAAGIPIVSLPGPSAALSALVVSGLPTDRFCFEGFLPRKGRERKDRLAAIAADQRTSIMFESPRRTAATLHDLANACGPGRQACVARELTKTHEEVVRGTLAELAEWADGREVLGEVTLVIAGADPKAPLSAEDPSVAADVAKRVAALVAGGLSRRDAVDTVAAETGLPRRTVYSAALAADV
jgi:16S rRNA (cytidine1402-2'-O)-methyltransferase